MASKSQSSYPRLPSADLTGVHTLSVGVGWGVPQADVLYGTGYLMLLWQPTPLFNYTGETHQKLVVML